MSIPKPCSVLSDSADHLVDGMPRSCLISKLQEEGWSDSGECHSLGLGDVLADGDACTGLEDGTGDVVAAATGCGDDPDGWGEGVVPSGAAVV